MKKKSDAYLSPNVLTSELYCQFHQLVGFRDYSAEDVDRALQGTLYSVVAYAEGEAIGIARVVGDGRIVFFIKDVIVHPHCKGQGFGRLLMEDLMSYIGKTGCPGAYIGLMSTPGTEGFYERLGFRRRPNDEYGAGMTYFLGEADA